MKNYTYTTSTTDDFHSSTYSSKIKTVSFINNMTIPETAIVTWDLSLEQDNSIKGWLVPNSEDSTMYDFYIGSNGIILANANSSYLFYNLPSAISISFNNFDTSNVTTMYWMFNNCSSLTSLDVSKFDTSNVTTMASMFRGCSSLTSLDLSNFDTSNVTNMQSMFSRCSSLTSLDLSNFDTSKVENIENMFYYCSSLTSLDISNFDTSKTKSMVKMFYNASKLKTIYVGSKWNTANVITTVSMFSGCGTDTVTLKA